MNKMMAVLLSMLLWSLMPEWSSISSATASASDYYTQNGVVYERYVVSEPYWYCGRKYCRNVYRYREVVNYKSPTWREQALTLIDRQKERESFNQTLSYLGAQNLMAPAPFAVMQGGQGIAYGQSGAVYPSQTGNTVGGFASYEYQRFGQTSSLDVNRANEMVSANIDSFNRATSDNARRADEIHAGVGGLIQMNSATVGAIAEAQEMRASVQALSHGMKEMSAGFAQAIREMKPQGSESLKFQAGRVAQVEVQSPSRPGGPQPPPDPTPPTAPNPNDSLTAADAELITVHCASCHGRDKAEPAGEFYFDLGVPLTEAAFGALAIRMDPQSPEKRDTGKAYRMPPSDFKAQPTLEERRRIVEIARLLVK